MAYVSHTPTLTDSYTSDEVIQCMTNIPVGPNSGGTMGNPYLIISTPGTKVLDEFAYAFPLYPPPMSAVLIRI